VRTADSSRSTSGDPSRAHGPVNPNATTVCASSTPQAATTSSTGVTRRAPPWRPASRELRTPPVSRHGGRPAGCWPGSDDGRWAARTPPRCGRMAARWEELRPPRQFASSRRRRGRPVQAFLRPGSTRMLVGETRHAVSPAARSTSFSGTSTSPDSWVVRASAVRNRLPGTALPSADRWARMRATSPGRQATA